MTSAMGPPPPRNPNNVPELEAVSINEDLSSPVDLPLFKNPKPSDPEAVKEQPENQELSGDVSVSSDEKNPSLVQPANQSPVPYSIPEWSGPPRHRFQLEVLKDGSIVDQFNVYEKGAYMFGRVDICDFVLEHPTISRFHAVIQYKRGGDAYIFDLGSTHGTFVNKNQVDKRVYMDLHVGDVIRFGCSTRLYIFQGPSELMPPEKDLKMMREAKLRQEMYDREASLRRARERASLADGISWGMDEDAIEEEEEDIDEITWQTYKGQLTEKQEKTKDKVIKRMEKIAHMKKEIAAIRAKDISQGGLTQGQQTQIARNEQRIAQLLEELENLEETLNDSIRESLGARSGKKTRGNKKGAIEEEDFSSDEDEFYDRTKKKATSQKGAESQTVETVDSLLEKRERVMNEIQDTNKLISEEKNKIKTESVSGPEPGDSLDAYMTGLSSQLVQDTTGRLEQELTTLQTELDRILYLLKIADPTGEAIKKREMKLQEPKPKPNESEKPIDPPPAEQKKIVPTKPTDVSERGKEEIEKVSAETDSKLVAEKTADETSEVKATVYIPPKPLWLGAVVGKEAKEETKPRNETASEDADAGDEFVDYKDRKKILATQGSEIENSATGLIIRKRKKEEEKGEENGESEEKQAEVMAQHAVALLLKHSGGYCEEDDETIVNKDEEQPRNHPSKKKMKTRKKKKNEKKVLGPEKPDSLEENSEYDSWVPPEGQSGDGRTSLNDRYGY